MTDINIESETLPGGKSPGIATLLSFVCCGAGQVYNGDVIKGALFFLAAVFSGVLLGYAAFVIVLPLIIAGMIEAHRTATAFNRKLLIATKEKELAIEAAAKLSKETFATQDFVAKLDKLFRLSASNLLDSNEFAERKKEVILVLITRKPRESAEDFLYALIPLVNSGALTADEVAQIKTLIL